MSHQSISRNSAAHYTWAGVCDGWHLMDSAGLSVIEERVPPGAREERHFHQFARQFFYVLEGLATMEVDGVKHEMQAGAGIEVAPNSHHQFINASDADVRFLVISAPSAKGDRTASTPVG